MEKKEIGIFETKTHLSEIITRVEEDGAVYQITKRGKPVAELRPIQPEKPPRLKFGYGKSKDNYIADDFDEPLEDFKAYME
jgi:prevent-host-death family protein